mmetsp:Transcript_7431/g.19091  ORF Transcript_7431/g.19091 Transcript_7431/m.19091 type:complete len:279 (-) Transcript_7431:509-1345(-)
MDPAQDQAGAPVSLCYRGRFGEQGLSQRDGAAVREELWGAPPVGRPDRRDAGDFAGRSGRSDRRRSAGGRRRCPGRQGRGECSRGCRDGRGSRGRGRGIACARQYPDGAGGVHECRRCRRRASTRKSRPTPGQEGPPRWTVSLSTMVLCGACGRCPVIGRRVAMQSRDPAARANFMRNVRGCVVVHTGPRGDEYTLFDAPSPCTNRAGSRALPVCGRGAAGRGAGRGWPCSAPRRTTPPLALGPDSLRGGVSTSWSGPTWAFQTRPGGTSPLRRLAAS